MAAKKPAPKAVPAKSASAKAAAKPTPKVTATKGTPKAGAINNAPKAVKKAKPAPVVKKGPIALRTPATHKPTAPATTSDHATSTPHIANESGTYYIVVEHEDLRISTAKPKSNGRIETAATFDEAKDKAMDCLIDLIDRFERRLWEVKQSLDHETLVDRD